LAVMPGLVMRLTLISCLAVDEFVGKPEPDQ
jgi:hypothetical protein